jgi:hypothetical protein
LGTGYFPGQSICGKKQIIPDPSQPGTDFVIFARPVTNSKIYCMKGEHLRVCRTRIFPERYDDG